MRLKDLALEPYEIEIENEHSFTLLTISTITDKTSKNYGKTKETQEGYFTSIESVVKALIKKKQADKNKHADEQVMTLQQFLNDYARFANQFSKLMQKALSNVGIKEELEKI